MTKTNNLLLQLQFNDGDFQQVCTSVGTLQNNHGNNSVEQKHSKREHHILFWIKVTTHLWDSNNKKLHCQDKWQTFLT